MRTLLQVKKYGNSDLTMYFLLNLATKEHSFTTGWNLHVAVVPGLRLVTDVSTNTPICLKHPTGTNFSCLKVGWQPLTQLVFHEW